jgi:hypothetical protein
VQPSRSAIATGVAAVVIAAWVGAAQADPVQPPPVAMPVSAPIPLVGEPIPGNMAYFGGRVLRAPRIYLVFWGWRGHDPDGVAHDLIRFFTGVGGSSWQQVTTQYYETVHGNRLRVTNPRHQLRGVWFDDRTLIHDNLSNLDIAREAQRAVLRFNAGRVDPQADYLIATPSDANSLGFNQRAYCAWHDSTTDAAYPGVQPNIAFTDLPYVLDAGAGCGQNTVNMGRAGRLDGVTEAAGHEYLETITDPDGAVQERAAWQDVNRDENADKCAYTRYGPGAVTDITLATGTFAVQGTWSNAGLDGTGACSTG